jgi:hypothetical protein
VRWQVEELPVTQVRITEHRAARVGCRAVGSRCAASCLGRSPRARSARFQAAVATLCTRNRVSRRDVVELCDQLFGLRIRCPGRLDSISPNNRQGFAAPLAIWVG